MYISTKPEQYGWHFTDGILNFEMWLIEKYGGSKIRKKVGSGRGRHICIWPDT